MARAAARSVPTIAASDPAIALAFKAHEAAPRRSKTDRNKYRNPTNGGDKDK
jgi:hypothetical protein